MVAVVDARQAVAPFDVSTLLDRLLDDLFPEILVPIVM